MSVDVYRRRGLKQDTLLETTKRESSHVPRVRPEEHRMTTHRIESFDAPPSGELVAVEVNGTKVAVAVIDGVAYAVDDECTHRQCSLSDGDVEGGSVVCPCHGGT